MPLEKPFSLDTDILAGIEDIVGGADADTLVGDATMNMISGRGGYDVLDGGPGRDAVDYECLSTGFTAILDSAGRATVTAASGDTDVLVGIEDVLGGAGNDALVGDDAGNANDGGAGDDTISGGAGADTLSGGNGADRFAYAADALDAADVIGDFAAGDVLDLSALMASLGATSSTALDFVSLVQSGTAVQARLDQNGVLAGNTDTLVATISNQSAAQVQAQTNFG